MKTAALLLIPAFSLPVLAQRPEPTFAKIDLAKGPARFVDAGEGNDDAAGGEKTPWKSLSHAFRQLKPGETLYLRGGIYYEKAAVVRSGSEAAPITISAYPDETAIIDGSVREFSEAPETAWEPLADGEYVSTKRFPEAESGRVPTQFLPAAWEPMWNIEEQRPLALGCFEDSHIPLHGYRHHRDLVATNEFWLENIKDDTGSLYCGPGLWFNRETGRVHCRLAHHTLPGLGDRAYRGETDPRKVPLVVALGFGEEVLRLTGVKHVNLRNLVFRGATGSPMISLYGCEGIAIDHCAVYGGNPALLVNASRKVLVSHCVMRGNAAPWTGRAHMKYRGTASYQIVLRDDQPQNEEIEFANCEFTDDHDFAFLRFAKNLRLHHCFVDNFNDDGFEIGPKRRDHTLFLYQNRIGGILSHFTQHEMDKDESPLDHDAGSGAYIYRNVIDQRPGAYYTVPATSDPSGAFLHYEGHLAGDHGGPVWAVMRWYHNTVLRNAPAYRDYFLQGLGAQGTRQTERDVFNNLFLQSERMPGAGFAGMKEVWPLREGGNLLWSPNDAGTDPFVKFRASPLFEASKKFQAEGWTTRDLVADPHFVSDDDLTLQKGSPAIDAGLPLPTDWPDPLREEGKPDIGAVPHGGMAWGVGVDGRIPLFGP